jgi:signal transduction histidine kinase
MRSERVVFETEGQPHYADVMVYPLVANGALGAVIRVDDVTNRVRIEQMMVQTEKMLSVGGLAAGMAHEINNPLSAVLQGCQNIQRRLSADLTMNREVAENLGVEFEKIRDYLQERGIFRFLEGIQEAGRRATGIVNDMLAFSRRSKAELAPARVDEMLDVVIRLAGSDYDLKKNYDFRQIEIVRDYDPNLDWISCDRTEIEQVLLNLVKNAAQAMSNSPGLKPLRITLRTRKLADHACIEVEDTGPGMDEETCRRVFEPFFTTKVAGVGTGLGLSVSYFIITEQHRGDIQVSSGPGQGTCFTIRLPLGPRRESKA